MELVLTGNTMSAIEAERYGIVTRLFPAHEVLEAAKNCARTIAAHSGPVVQLAKQAVINGEMRMHYVFIPPSLEALTVPSRKHES